MTEQIFHIGKYKGKPISDVPLSYLEWVVKTFTHEATVQAAVSELDRRADVILKGEAEGVTSMAVVSATASKERNRSRRTMNGGKNNAI